LVIRQRKILLAHAASPISGLSTRFRWLHGPATTYRQTGHSYCRSMSKRSCRASTETD